MANKSKKSRAPYLGVVVAVEPADAVMKRVRMAMLGASDADWRDQDWETPHGRLFLRSKRYAQWSAMPEKQRPKLSPRDLVFIDRDQFNAAVRFLEIRMAFLRAFGAPGLPFGLAGDDKFTCPVCGADTKCIDCEQDFQSVISNKYDEVNRVIRSAGAGCREAISSIIVNPASSYEYRPEEIFSGMVPALAKGLSALDDMFRLNGKVAE